MSENEIDGNVRYLVSEIEKAGNQAKRKLAKANEKIKKDGLFPRKWFKLQLNIVNRGRPNLWVITSASRPPNHANQTDFARLKFHFIRTRRLSVVPLEHTDYGKASGDHNHWRDYVGRYVGTCLTTGQNWGVCIFSRASLQRVKPLTVSMADECISQRGV